MTTRGLSFTSENILKVIDGRKVQTRRVMKPQPRWDDGAPSGPSWRWRTPRGGHEWWTPDAPRRAILDWSPCGKAGGLIWVREAFAYSMKDVDSAFDEPPTEETHDIVYRATSEGTGEWTRYEEVDGKMTSTPCEPDWRPARHMPRWASRLKLELVETRVQRLTEINTLDIRAEGITCPGDATDEMHCPPKPGIAPCDGLLAEFVRLWNGINRKGLTWGDDPWVWAYTFKLVEGA